MLYKDLNGEQHKVNFARKRNRERAKSKLHEKALSIIKELVPLTIVCEEVPIKIKRGKTLYLDIFLPDYNIAIEVHGKQHYEFVKAFHGYAHRFGRAQLNDTLKREWCELNGIRIIELKYNEIGEWADRIAGAIR